MMSFPSQWTGIRSPQRAIQILRLQLSRLEFSCFFSSFHGFLLKAMRAKKKRKKKKEKKLENHPVDPIENSERQQQAKSAETEGIRSAAPLHLWSRSGKKPGKPSRGPNCKNQTAKYKYLQSFAPLESKWKNHGKPPRGPHRKS